VTPSDRDCKREEADGREVEREVARFGFFKSVGFSTVPTAIIAVKIELMTGPNRYKDRNVTKPMTTPETTVS